MPSIRERHILHEDLLVQLGWVRRLARTPAGDAILAADVAQEDWLKTHARGVESRGGLRPCWRCHSGPNFSDESFHNTGIGADQGAPEDGRFAITGEESDRGRFKTQTLRALARTSPYMHDGSLANLEQVVEFYRGGGRPNAGLDPAIEPLGLTDQNAANLVAFLRALSGSQSHWSFYSICATSGGSYR